MHVHLHASMDAHIRVPETIIRLILAVMSHRLSSVFARIDGRPQASSDLSELVRVGGGCVVFMYAAVYGAPS